MSEERLNSMHDATARDSGTVDRRGFLRRMGAVGAGLAATSMLSACAGRGATAGAAATQAETPKLALPSNGTLSGDQIVFRGWNYHPEVVEDNVRRFNAMYDENVDYQTVSGDYPSIMTTMNINRLPLNFAYANNDDVFRWYMAGWAWDLEGYWNIEQVKKDLYPAWRDALSTRDGKLLGLPYFQSVRGTLSTNEEMLQKMGITSQQYPKTWDELYDQVYQIKKAGLSDTPLLPHWFATSWFGISWGFEFECGNRGAVLFDENGNPVFDDKCYAILDQWKTLFADGVVPKEVFTMGETDYIDGFASGRYAYSPQQTYDNKVFNDPTRSKLAIGGSNPNAKGSKFVPVDKQPWGLINSGVYLNVKRPGEDEKSLARAYRLQEFYGYKDNQGQLFVSKRWAVEQALNSGYPATLEDPDVQAAYRQWMPDYESMFPAMKSLLAAASAPAVWKRYFHSEWNTKATTELSQAVLGQRGTKESLDDLKALAERLINKYKKVDPG